MTTVMIPFNKPPYTGREDAYVIEAMRSPHLSGDGPFSKKCEAWLGEQLGCSKALMTPSCTQALEMAAILAGIKPGDEVIMPSYTFVSTANAFALHGAQIVFVDIRPDTMNINHELIEAAVTEKTRVIVPVHYAGVGCDMNAIMDIAQRHDLIVVEDAAQGVAAKVDGRALGTIGHLGAFSFHETKNCTSGGEGGALLINDARFIERAEIIREKGTNRAQFFRGFIDKYSWVDIGGSYLPSELQCAYLYAQLELLQKLTDARLRKWNRYRDALSALDEAGKICIAKMPGNVEHNAHMFYLKCRDLEERRQLIGYLRDKGYMAVFHYVPLHSSKAGLKYGRFHGEDLHTTTESERLLRLPIYHGLADEHLDAVIEHIRQFYS